MAVMYDENSVSILDDISHIQTRPGMYIGDCDTPIHLFFEILDNSIDESSVVNDCKVLVKIDTKKNSYFIQDNARGIPIGTKKDKLGKDRNVLDILVTTTNSGAKFDNSSYLMSAGLHGVGLCVTNALSEYFQIQSCRKNKSVTFAYENGRNIEPKIELEKQEHGTQVYFIPNKDKFDNPVIPKEKIIERCRISNAFGVNISLYIDEEEIDVNYKLSDLFPEENNINIYQEYPIIQSSENKLEERIATLIRYTSDTKDKYFGYTNLISNPVGGTHIKFISKVIIEAWERYIEQSKIKLEVELRKSDYLIGLRCICAVFIKHPNFSSQTKEELSVSKNYFDDMKELIIKKIVSSMKFFDRNSKALIRRFEEYRISQNKLLARKEISSLIKVNEDSPESIRRRSVVPKLIECVSKGRKGTELYISEGDSAIGSITRCRNKTFQAGLPLRGKILNVAGMDIKKCLKSETIRDIINSVGCGIGSQCDSSRSRYEKIIISTDADTDGCFQGDTVVELLDNKKATFEELVDMERKNPGQSYWVYSKDNNGRVFPAKAYYPRITKYIDKLLQITLDNGKVIRCTHYHPFLMKSVNIYLRANELKVEDMLSGMIIDPDTGWYNSNFHQTIKSIDEIELNEKIPVYDITVPEYHNFMIDTRVENSKFDTGIFVHNSHIQNLVMGVFINLMPDIVKDGRLYMVVPPLYGWKDSKGKYVYSNDFDDIPKGIKFTRFKGLGEMNDDQYEYACMNPKTRILYQIDYPSDIDKFNKILGTTEGKADMLNELGLVRRIEHEY